MANTYTQIYFHIVFSTKNRVDWIDPKIENRIWAYLGGIARKHKMTGIQVGGIDNHIHALIGSPPILSPSQIAKCLKGDSSLWIHREFQAMNGFDGKTVTVRFPCRSQRYRELSSTSRTSEYITKRRLSRKNMFGS